MYVNFSLNANIPQKQNRVEDIALSMWEFRQHRALQEIKLIKINILCEIVMKIRGYDF